jgi:hypothetical protein
MMQLKVNEQVITIVPTMAYVTNCRKNGEATIKIHVKTGVLSLSEYQKECIERSIMKIMKEV